MKKIVLWVFGIVVVIFLFLFLWSNISSRVLFYVRGNDKSGLKLSSYKNLSEYLVKLEKNEKIPLLLSIKINDYVPESQNFRIYRRFEPIVSSPIVIGCNWKKNFGFWNLDLFVEPNLLKKMDEKSINYAISSCFLNIFNDGVYNNTYRQKSENSIKLLDSINQGIIFKK